MQITLNEAQLPNHSTLTILSHSKDTCPHLIGSQKGKF